MRKQLPWALCALLAAGLVLAACGGAETEPGPVENAPVPAEYADMQNPLAGQAEAVAAGQDLYKAYCVSCHGEDARGDGPAAKSLTPRPADLLEPAANDSDGELFYRIAEGNQVPDMKGSAMVSWKGTFSDQQIWQVIAYLRNLAGK